MRYTPGVGRLVAVCADFLDGAPALDEPKEVMCPWACPGCGGVQPSDRRAFPGGLCVDCFERLGAEICKMAAEGP